jgi:NTP pyrophosphatase (non-canonical NTP hydrolase)
MIEKGAKMEKILEEIKAERSRQDKKFGTQNWTPIEWIPILGEEFGEVCRAVTDWHWQLVVDGNFCNNYRKELIQLAATAISALESFDRLEWPDRHSHGECKASVGAKKKKEKS